MRVIFLRIGWMDRYRGVVGDDRILGGGSFVATSGYGHEIYNFLPHGGRVYGYVQPTRAGYNNSDTSGISMKKLGAAPKADSIDDVLAVWVARHPLGGSYIVGWYDHATVYRRWQPPPAGANRKHKGEEFGYYVMADEKNAVLLPHDSRLFRLPRGKGYMGQSNVWYADGGEASEKFQRNVVQYVRSGAMPVPAIEEPGAFHQLDPLLRVRIEKTAVEETVKHFAALGYQVRSVEKDNLGWDLEAGHPERPSLLKLEVKGLSGKAVTVEVTPNEYRQMQANRNTYRVCVVTNCLENPCLNMFRYSSESKKWEDKYGAALEIVEIISARLTA